MPRGRNPSVNDWDGITYCTNQDGRPATIKVILGMYHDTPIYELVCSHCALQLHLEHLDGNDGP